MGIITPKKITERDEHGEKLTDQWETPPEKVFELVRHFKAPYPRIDAAASAKNTKCDFYITRQQDNLIVDWFEYAKALDMPPYYWHNCPYSNPILSKQVARAYEMAKKGCYVLGYYPASTSPEWFHRYIYDALPPANYLFQKGRTAFIAPPGIVDNKRPAGDNLAVYFTPEVCK